MSRLILLGFMARPHKLCSILGIVKAQDLLTIYVMNVANGFFAVILIVGFQKA
jgi:hypothetical protein